MNPERHRVNNVCFKFLYFGFILLLHLSVFIIMNIQWSKKPHYNQSCLWNLHFLVCSCYFWKDKSFLVLNFFKLSEYLDQIPSWKEMKEASSVKLQNENRSYCLLQKLSKAQVGCQNKEYNKIFKHINQNIRAYPKSKKNMNWSKIQKIFLRIRKNPRKVRCW